MLVSVIVPTSRRNRSLARALRTILRQSLPRQEFEVIVVENGPPSGARWTCHAARLGHPGINLRYLHEPTPGLLAGRHRGALEARGEILVFADDDIDASSGWLSAVVRGFGDRAVHFVGGRNLPLYEVQPPAWVESYWYRPPYGGRACVYLSLLDLGDDPLVIDATYVWGLNFAIRRQTLFDLGGFHPDNPPEHLQHFQGDGETGLSRKANEAGLRVVYAPEAVVYHRVPLERFTADYFRRRFFRQGVCDSFTALRKQPESFSEHSSTAAPSAEFDEVGSSMKSGSARRARLGHLLKLLAARPRRIPERDASLTYPEIEPQTRAAYEAGYSIHQEVVRANRTLQEWVARRDYWDYRFPDIGDCAFARKREEALGRQV